MRVRVIRLDEVESLVEENRYKAMKAAILARVIYGKSRGGRRRLEDSFKLAKLASRNSEDMLEVVKWSSKERVLRMKSYGESRY